MASKKEDKTTEQPTLEEIQKRFMLWFENNITAIALFQDALYDVMEKVYRYHIPMNVVHFHFRMLVMDMEKQLYENLTGEEREKFLQLKSEVDTVAGNLVETGTDPRQLAEAVRAKLNKDKKKQATDWIQGYQ